MCDGSLIPDVMHDLLEGTLQYEAKLVLKHVICNGFLTYKQFSEALGALEMAYMEADNKPTAIAWQSLNSDSKSLGQKGESL